MADRLIDDDPVQILNAAEKLLRQLKNKYLFDEMEMKIARQEVTAACSEKWLQNCYRLHRNSREDLEEYLRLHLETICAKIATQRAVIAIPDSTTWKNMAEVDIAERISA